MGLLPSTGKISSGQIIFQDSKKEPSVDLVNLSAEEKREYRGGKIAMIFQEPMSSLNPVYNIGFQIIEAIRLHQKVSKKQAKQQAINLLQEVKLLPTEQQLVEEFLSRNRQVKEKEIKKYIEQRKKTILKRYPHELSGGQLQRVMIAMAISCQPSILIADEPTTALDVTVQATILELLKDLCERRHMSMIFITHDLAVVANLVDRIMVMYEGKIVESAPTRDLLFNAQKAYTKGLLSCRPRLDETRSYLPTVADFLNNQETTPETSTPSSETREINLNQPLLSVRNLRVGFSQAKQVPWQKQEYFWAINDLSFELFSGETLGLVGESGCGKSTLARTILRLIPAQAGSIKFLGEELRTLSSRSNRLRQLRREMQIVFQNPYNSLNPRMSIGQIILEPMIIHRFGGTKKKRTERVKYLLERAGLNPDWFNRYPHELSGGQRQRVCIARALALNPQLIICDESVSALDVSIQAQVLNLLKELQVDFGLTYIFISHDLSVVKFMSDRIMVMNKGKIEEMSTTEQIIYNPQREYTRKLIASIPEFPEVA
jgi:peptide/nickel transport system ATP-binding protein